MGRSCLTSSLGAFWLLIAAGRAAAAVGLTVELTQTPVDATVYFGNPISYRILVVNSGDETLDNLTVVDTISPVVTGVTVSQPAAFGPPDVSSVSGATRYEWSQTGLTFPPGGTFTLTISGQLGLVCANTKIASSLSVTGGAGASSTTLLDSVGPSDIYEPGLDFSLSVYRDPAEVAVGGELLYRIVVANTGDAPIYRMTVVDTISPILTNVRTFQPAVFGAASVAQADGGTRYEWSANDLAMQPGETYTFTITGMVGTIPALTGLSNTVWASASSGCATNFRETGAQTVSLYDYLQGQGIPVAAPDPSHPRAVKLSWQPALPGSANYAVSGYLIYRSNDGGGTTVFVATDYCIPDCGQPRSIIDIVPEYGKRYVYIIHPVDVNGNVGRSYHLVMIDIVLPSNRIFLDHNAVRPDRGQYLSVHFQITEPGRVRISVLTPTGELIKTIYDREHYGAFSPEVPFYSKYQGLPAVIWDIADSSGRRVTSGIYFVVLEIGESRDIRSVAVIR